MDRALKQLFERESKVVKASEKNSMFSIRKDRHSHNITDNHVRRWKDSAAVRELVSNWIDRCVEQSNKVGRSGAVTYLDDGKYDDAGKSTYEWWNVVASLDGSELGRIEFKYGKDGRFKVKLTNWLTRLHVLKIFGFGYSTKVNDPTQAGKFGDGLKSATATLARAGDRGRRRACDFKIFTGGWKWLFKFEKDGDSGHSWMVSDKSCRDGDGKKFAGAQTRETSITVKWPHSTSGRWNMDTAFDPHTFTAFAPPDDVLKLNDTGAALMFGNHYTNSIYVTGVRVCESATFVRGVGYTDDVNLRPAMTRDRSVLPYDNICISFCDNVRGYLNNGGEIGRIYNLVADVDDADDWCAYLGLKHQTSGAWNNAFASEFKRLHGADAYPYNEIHDRAVVERDIGMKPVHVNRILYDILDDSGHFESVDDAVWTKFVDDGEFVEWPESHSHVRKCASIVASELMARAHGAPLEKVDVEMRKNGCKRTAMVEGDSKVCTLYLRASKVRQADRAAAKKSYYHTRILLHSVMHALQDLSRVPTLSRVDVAYMYARIGDVSRGAFDEVYDEVDETTDEETTEEEAPGHISTDNDGLSSESEESAAAEPSHSASRTSGNKRPHDYSDDDDDEEEGGGGDEEPFADVVAEPPKSPPPWAAEKRARTSHIEPPKGRSVDLSFDRISTATGSEADDAAAKEVAEAAAAVAAAGTRGANMHAHTTEMEREYVITNFHAVVFKVGAQVLGPLDANLFIEVALWVRTLLRHVFKWDDDTTFGIYREDSNTAAFTQGGSLFINAHHHPKEGHTENYFSVLLHEHVHLAGYMPHDNNFTSAMHILGKKYLTKLRDFTMVRMIDGAIKGHITQDCSVTCLRTDKLMCFEHNKK